MTKRKILFSGCSFTADSGFLPENKPRHHWVDLFSNHFDCYYQNIAIGGMSNNEIFQRTTETVLDKQFDLVIVMWSSIGRRWIYHNDQNIDDYTIINSNLHSALGHKCDAVESKQIHKLNTTYFENQYMNLKHWLLEIIALEHLLKRLQLPYIFAKGSENFLDDFKASQVLDHGFVIPDTIRPLLDFDHRPDYFIKEKLMAIKRLIGIIDSTHWVNWDQDSFASAMIDVADDQKHPGTVSNQKFFDQLKLYTQEKNLL